MDVGKGSAMAGWRRDGTVCSMPVALPLLPVEAAEPRDTVSDRVHIATVREIQCAKTT